MQFLSARNDPLAGWIRLGGIPDLGLRRPVAPGKHLLGRLVFVTRGGEPTGSLDAAGPVAFHGGRLVGPDLGVVLLQQATSDAGRPDLRPAALPPPTALTLSAPLPNPTAGSTRISWGTAAAGRVRLAVYDISGREVGTLFEGMASVGWHVAEWRAGDASAGRLPAGVYFARLTGNGGTRVQRLILVR